MLLLPCRTCIASIIDGLASHSSHLAPGLPALIVEVVQSGQGLPQPCSPLTQAMLQQLAELAIQRWVAAACSSLAATVQSLQSKELYELAPRPEGTVGCSCPAEQRVLSVSVYWQSSCAIFHMDHSRQQAQYCAVL